MEKFIKKGIFHKKILNMKGWVWQVRVDIFVIVILGMLVSVCLTVWSQDITRMTTKSEAAFSINWQFLQLDEDWNCQVIFNSNFHQYPFHIVTNLQLYFPNSSIFYPWMHEKFQQSASKSISIFSVIFIFLPFFWCYMFETVPLWWAHWICSCSDCQLESHEIYFLCQ
jgi:hypothetical protein